MHVSRDAGSMPHARSAAIARSRHPPTGRWRLAADRDSCSAPTAPAAVAGACGGACRWAARPGKRPRATPNRAAFKALVESGARIGRARVRRRHAGGLVRGRPARANSRGSSAARRWRATGPTRPGRSTACTFRARWRGQRRRDARWWRRPSNWPASAWRHRDRGLSAGVRPGRAPGRAHSSGPACPACSSRSASSRCTSPSAAAAAVSADELARWELGPGDLPQCSMPPHNRLRSGRVRRPVFSRSPP